MPLSEILLLSFESFFANKLRTGLTMLGMIIGVGAVVLLVSIGNGARNYITSEFEGLGTNMIMIQPGKSDKRTFGPPVGGAKEKLTEADVEAVERQALSVEAVTGIVFGTGQIKYLDRSSNSMVLGSNDKFPRIINLKIRNGEFFTSESDVGRRVAVLGANVARDLFDEEEAVGKLIKINESDYRVIGVTAKAGQSLGLNMDDMVFVPVRAAMKLFNEDKIMGIRARAKSKVGLDDAVAEITEIIKARHNGEEDFTVLTQLSMLQTMNTILGMLTYVLGGIAMISMVVGGIGIMNIMLVSVTERTKEIGIRRAVGARQVDILKQFIVEAVCLSVFGGMIGLLGSVSLTYLIYFIAPKFDTRAPLWIVIPAFFVSAATGVLFGVWPARKAARIETIEALRFE